MSVIERAEKRLQEEIHQNDLGADNGHLMAYWSAYLDGARAQLPKRGEIVRCKDCKWSISCGYISTRSYAEWKDWFCADGEKMEVQDEQ